MQAEPLQDIHQIGVRIDLRSLKVSGPLEAYWAFHFCREHERNYPSAPIPEALQQAA